MDKDEFKGTDWKWRYTLSLGIMYGPIPVGLIFVIILATSYLVYRFAR